MKQWKDVKGIAALTGISYAQWRSRVDSGMDRMEAATRPIQKQTKVYVIDGVEATTGEHCRHKGVSLNTIKGRMKRYGISFPEALKYAIDKSQSRRQ